MATHSTPSPASRRGPYRNGVRTRHEILESATRVFAQRGFIGGTLRQIADEVGVSPAALLRHFASKEELLAEVLATSDARNGEELFGDREGLAYFDRSGALVRRNVENRRLVELLLTVKTEASDPAHPARPFMERRSDTYVTQLSAQLRTARDRGEIGAFTDEELEKEVHGYIALMDGLELQWLLDPELDLVSLWDRHYAGLRGRWIAGPR
jgi:AcrR family transcriptional regulator